MKKLTTLFTASSIAIFSFAQDSWVQKADAGSFTRNASTGFSINDKGYMATGDNSSGTPQKDCWEYDPSANSWTQKADFGGAARYDAVGFSIGNKGYVGTGYDGTSFFDDFYEYDPAANSWSAKADFGGTPRATACGFATGGKGYIGTGAISFTTSENDFWEYDPAGDNWSAITDFPGSPRSGATAFAIAGMGYVGTGYEGSWPSGTVKKDFYEYDPNTDSWSTKANFGGTARSLADGFSIGGLGFIGCGWEDPSEVKDFWEYEPGSNSWTQRADFGGSARQVAIGFSVSGKGYIGTGFNVSGSNEKDFWEYTPLSLGIQQPKENFSRIYPNPASDQIKVEFPYVENRKLIVFNSIGEVVHEGMCVQIDCSSWTEGTYYLYSEGFSETIIVQR
jgi:N-acetylneuraminic acid mutarotase